MVYASGKRRQSIGGADGRPGDQRTWHRAIARLSLDWLVAWIGRDTPTGYGADT